MPLRLTTFDSSGEVVHPDHVAAPSDCFGFSRQLAIMSYPSGNATMELPSVFAGGYMSESRRPVRRRDR